MIYLDNAATTRPCPAALDAMRTALEDAWGNPSALYRPGQQARKLVEDARRTVARVLHAVRPAEITFTSGGTESDGQALYTGAALGASAGKRHIISTQIEHHAVLHTLQALQTQGFTVTLLPPSAAGLITPQQLADALQPDTCLVSIMFANNEIGTVQPIAELGAFCREHGVLFHTDAVQAAGHLAIDVQATNIDLLSLSGHKFHGPKGAGALYTRRGIVLQNVLYGGGQERGHPDNARGHGAQQILFGAHTERHERDHHGKEKERLNDVAFLAQRQHQVAPHHGQKEVKHGSPPPLIPQQKRDAWGQRPTRPP